MVLCLVVVVLTVAVFPVMFAGHFCKWLSLGHCSVPLLPSSLRRQWTIPLLADHLVRCQVGWFWLPPPVVASSSCCGFLLLLWRSYDSGNMLMNGTECFHILNIYMLRLCVMIVVVLISVSDPQEMKRLVCRNAEAALKVYNTKVSRCAMSASLTFVT